MRPAHVCTGVRTGVADTGTTTARCADHAGTATAGAGTAHTTGTPTAVAASLPVLSCRPLPRTMFLDIISNLNIGDGGQRKAEMTPVIQTAFKMQHKT